MATPHVAGVAAIIKQKHPHWSPSAIASAIMITADTTDTSGLPIQAQASAQTPSNLAAATPFDYGAGFINPAKAIDPGLVLDIEYQSYIQFLCAVPGVDNESVRQAVGTVCPSPGMEWCSDLNTPSVTVANLVGSRRVVRRVTSVASDEERYRLVVREPPGVGVTVTPQEFTISPNASRDLTIDLMARDVASVYAFGEVVLHGDQKHIVRIPVAIFVRSTLSA